METDIPPAFILHPSAFTLPKMFRPPGQCPVCHEFVPRNSKACPDCGACAKSGWNDKADYLDGVDLPEDPDEFDYDEFTREAFGSGKSQPEAKPWWWWVAWILIAITILSLFL